MNQRGVRLEEIHQVINDGRPAPRAKRGTLGKVMVFDHDAEWEGQVYPEKEVTVYYKLIDEQVILLTVLARYGRDFEKG
jgi:hypothetical protein